MLPEMTPAVARALQSAHAYAASEGQTERRPVHVLHGLLEEEEGRAAVLAVRAGLVVHLYQARHARSGRTAAADQPVLPIHKATRTVLNHAREIQRELTAETTIAGEV